MIIPAVYVFSGTEGMSAGPSLMFVSLPKVFNAMGKAGVFVGILFFVTAIFATLTSCISVLESITANCMEIFHTGRKKTVLVLTVIYLTASAVIALGYSIFYFEVKLPNGSTGQLLDIMDYISNSFMMPLISLLSTILIGWIVTPDYVIDEMERSGDKFRRKKLYRVMIRFVAPVIECLFCFYSLQGFILNCRACLRKTFCKMCLTICERLYCKKTSSLPSLYGDWMFFIICNCKDTEALLISHCQRCSASSISSINIKRKLMRSRMLDTQMALSP